MDKKTVFAKTEIGESESLGNSDALFGDAKRVLHLVDDESTNSCNTFCIESRKLGGAHFVISATVDSTPTGKNDLDFSFITAAASQRPSQTEAVSHKLETKITPESAIKIQPTTNAIHEADAKAAKLKAYEDAKIKAQIEVAARARIEAEARAKQNTDAVRIRAEQEAHKARAEAEAAKARIEAEVRARLEAEARVKQEAEARIKREAEAIRIKAEKEAEKLRLELEAAKAKAEMELRIRLEAEARAKSNWRPD